MIANVNRISSLGTFLENCNLPNIHEQVDSLSIMLLQQWKVEGIETNIYEISYHDGDGDESWWLLVVIGHIDKCIWNPWHGITAPLHTQRVIYFISHALFCHWLPFHYCN